MSWKKTLLKNSTLYVIVDKQLSGNFCRGGLNSYNQTSVCRRGLNLAYRRSLEDIAHAASKAGVKIIQLRFKHRARNACLKQALKIRKALDSKTLFIINDFADIAILCCADGVHLGQEDGDISLARKILGKDAIIGRSCSTLNQAKIAQKQGADYIGVGPVFKTPAKPKSKTISPKVLKAISKTIKIPVFAIGGIDADNIKNLTCCGIKRVAVIRAVCTAPDIEEAVKNILKKLG